MSFAHFGIIIVIIGTILLAFAVKIKNRYTLATNNRKDKKYWGSIVKRAQDVKCFEPTVVYIDKKLFYAGLSCVAIGSLFQW